MEKLPKLYKDTYLNGMSFTDPYGKIEINEVFSESQLKGATHFEIEVDRDWDGVLNGFIFSFFQRVEETDEEYEKRMILVAKHAEEERVRREVYAEKEKKRKEDLEYQQYLSLKQKYEK